MPIKPTFPQQAKGFICIQIITRVGNSSRTQAISSVCSDRCVCIKHSGCSAHRPQGLLTVRAWMWGKPRRDCIVRASHTLPAFNQRLAIIIGGFGTVAQTIGRVAIHTGFSRNNAHVPIRRCGEKGLNAFGVNCAIAGHACRAIAQGKFNITWAISAA